MQTKNVSLNKRVLIIDDDKDLLEILAEYFGMEGFDVKTTSDTNNILDTLFNYKADIILIDYILKGINGGELCHQLKSSALYRQIPVGIISAYPRVLLSLGNYGCDIFISKPFDLSGLIKQVRQLLETGLPYPEQENFHLL